MWPVVRHVTKNSDHQKNYVFQTHLPQKPLEEQQKLISRVFWKKIPPFQIVCLNILWFHWLQSLVSTRSAIIIFFKFSFEIACLTVMIFPAGTRKSSTLKNFSKTKKSYWQIVRLLNLFLWYWRGVRNWFSFKKNIFLIYLFITWLKIVVAQNFFRPAIFTTIFL